MKQGLTIMANANVERPLEFETLDTLAERLLHEVGLDHPERAQLGFRMVLTRNPSMLDALVIFYLDHKAQQLRKGKATQPRTTPLLRPATKTKPKRRAWRAPKRRSDEEKRTAIAIARKRAQTVLDTFKVFDMPIGDYTMRELPALARRNGLEGSVIMRIRNHAPNADPNDAVRNVINAETLQRFIDEANTEA
jgi:hypothetical protein